MNQPHELLATLCNNFINVCHGDDDVFRILGCRYAIFHCDVILTLILILNISLNPE